MQDIHDTEDANQLPSLDHRAVPPAFLKELKTQFHHRVRGIAPKGNRLHQVTDQQGILLFQEVLKRLEGLEKLEVPHLRREVRESGFENVPQCHLPHQAVIVIDDRNVAQVLVMKQVDQMRPFATETSR